MAAKIKITLRKSPIGYAQNQKETARSLGFKKMNQIVVHDDCPVIRGMIHKIRHLVEVEPVTEETAADA